MDQLAISSAAKPPNRLICCSSLTSRADNEERADPAYRATAFSSRLVVFAPHRLTSDIRRCSSRAAQRHIDVDVLVNNAGFGAHGPVAGIGVQRQLEMIEVNVAALTWLTALLLPGMLERRRGGILNVASTAAFQPGPAAANPASTGSRRASEYLRHWVASHHATQSALA